MKKIFTLVAVLAFSVAFVGCGGASSSSSKPTSASNTSAGSTSGGGSTGPGSGSGSK